MVGDFPEGRQQKGRDVRLPKDERWRFGIDNGFPCYSLPSPYPCKEGEPPTMWRWSLRLDSWTATHDSGLPSAHRREKFWQCLIDAMVWTEDQNAAIRKELGL